MLLHKKGQEDISHELVEALHKLVALDPKCKDVSAQYKWVDTHLKLTLRELKNSLETAEDYLKREDNFIHSIRNKYKLFLSGLASMEHKNCVPDFDTHIEAQAKTTKTILSLIDTLLEQKSESPMHTLKEIVTTLHQYEKQSKLAAKDLKVVLKEIGDEYRLLREMTHSFHAYEQNVKSWLD